MHDILKKFGINRDKKRLLYNLKGLKNFLKKYSLIRTNYYVILPLTDDIVSNALTFWRRTFFFKF